MKIHLLRHTTPKIEKGICYGQANIKLANTFLDEVLKIKNKLRKIDFDIIFTSPLYRCKYLAEKLQHQQKIIEDKRLMELNFGNWELKSWKEVSEDKKSKPWFKDYINEPCPNGESFLDLKNRTINFITEIQTKYNNKTPLIVTHAGNIRAFQTIIEKKSLKNAFTIKVAYGEIKTFAL